MDTGRLGGVDGLLQAVECGVLAQGRDSVVQGWAERCPRHGEADEAEENGWFLAGDFKQVVERRLD